MCGDWENILIIPHTLAGDHKQQVHKKLCEMLAGTETGKILEKVTEEEVLEDLYRRYLHDYLRSIHQVLHGESELEYKVSC